MKKILFVLILLPLLYDQLVSQSLWYIGYTPQHSWDVAGDTSIANLKSMLNDETLTNFEFPNPHRYFSAARILAVNRGTAEKDFILSKLSRFANFGSPNFQWLFYFEYQRIRGFLGDNGAIAGMDSIVQFAPDLYLRLKAIDYLAVTGRLDYYDVVKQAFLHGGWADKQDAIELLGIYGEDPRYRTEVCDFLAEIAADSISGVAIGRISAFSGASNLVKLDQPRAAQIIDQRFRSSTGEERRDFFWDLEHIDPDGQPERTIFAVQSEPNEYSRSGYLPMYSSIVRGLHSKRFLLPFYIKFTKDFYLIESSSIVRWDLKEFINDFIPLSPPDSISINIQLDTLISFKTQVASYGWVGDNAFVNELTGYLTNARNALTSGDSSACARNIFIFQNKVDEEYRDSLDGDTRTINTEGWKFLHYHAQFILDKLSAITTLSLPINESWNMISLPLFLTDYKKQIIYPGASSDAFAYLNGTYVHVDTLKNGIGYWIKYPSDQLINYTGLKIDTIHIAVNNGWNMIGSVSQPISISKIYHPGVSILSSYFGYNGSTYVVSDTIAPGKGYWIKVGDNGTLILGIDASQQGGQNVIEPPPAPEAPSKPVLQSPSDGATGQSTSPTLSWLAASDAESYRLQVAQDSNFYLVVFNQEAITGLSYQVGPLSYNTKYYWHVKAYNDNGYSYWSNKRSFTTQAAPSAPPTPSLASPTNGATNVSTAPLLSWNSSSGATSYRLQVSTNSNFSDLVFDNASVTTTSKQVSVLLYSTTYYWRVNASNSNGTSGWSSVWLFTTRNAPSSDPCLPITSSTQLDELTISDAKGNRQNLFVHNGGRGLHLGHPDYDLPPETPIGAFHARFKSGKYIEIISPNKTVEKIPIKVKDFVFPLMLEWKLKSNNKIEYWLIDQKKNKKRIPLTGSGKYKIDSVADNLIYIEAQASLPCTY